VLLQAMEEGMRSCFRSGACRRRFIETQQRPGERDHEKIIFSVFQKFWEK